MNNPLVFKNLTDWNNYRREIKGTVGFVPTMGALHAGHASLLSQSKKENDITVLSIFVNPTQFNDPKDLEKYPRTFEADYKIASEIGIDAVFSPDFESIYPDQYRYSVTENTFSKILCGASRPGHFDGVLSVVMKLFNIIKPNKAYFGEKDFQQLRLIEDMVKAFFMPLEIRRGKTLREASGLAMSSRNVRLTTEGRAHAALIYKTITTTTTAAEAKNILNQNGFNVDYLDDIEDRRYVAAFLEGVRLIDNVTI
jgi:pantoate--beta-alanine ligase